MGFRVYYGGITTEGYISQRWYKGESHRGVFDVPPFRLISSGAVGGGRIVRTESILRLREPFHVAQILSRTSTGF